MHAKPLWASNDKNTLETLSQFEQNYYNYESMHIVGVSLRNQLYFLIVVSFEHITKKNIN